MIVIRNFIDRFKKRTRLSTFLNGLIAGQSTEETQLKRFWDSIQCLGYNSIVEETILLPHEH